MATTYKKITTSSAHNREVNIVDQTDKTKITTVVNNFITYFKSKHLS